MNKKNIALNDFEVFLLKCFIDEIMRQNKDNINIHDSHYIGNYLYIENFITGILINIENTHLKTAPKTIRPQTVKSNILNYGLNYLNQQSYSGLCYYGESIEESFTITFEEYFDNMFTNIKNVFISDPNHTEKYIFRSNGTIN